MTQIDWLVTATTEAETQARRLLFEVLGYEALAQYVREGRVTVNGQHGRKWVVSWDHAIFIDSDGYHSHRCVYTGVLTEHLPPADRVLSMAIQARSSETFFWDRSNFAICPMNCSLWRSSAIVEQEVVRW